jgi:lambda repressor-like predicted transcriptional regulator
MAEAKVTEEETIDHLRKSGSIDDSLASLSDVANMAPSALKIAVDSWKTISKSIIAARG